MPASVSNLRRRCHETCFPDGIIFHVDAQPADAPIPANLAEAVATVSFVPALPLPDDLDGTLQAHTLIRQDELAVAYGVSRMPIREAIRLLEAEGLVISRPNRGALVPPWTLKMPKKYSTSEPP
jgi:biotin operon repressor